MTDEVISRLSRILPLKDKSELKRNLPHATAWMKSVLEAIIERKKS